MEMAYNTGFNINAMIKNSASAGLILDDRRSKLLPETVEKLLFLQRQISHWTGRIQKLVVLIS